VSYSRQRKSFVNNRCSRYVKVLAFLVATQLGCRPFLEQTAVCRWCWLGLATSCALHSFNEGVVIVLFLLSLYMLRSSSSVNFQHWVCLIFVWCITCFPNRVAVGVLETPHILLCFSFFSCAPLTSP